MYTVIGARNTRAFRVIWTLEELGLPYDLIEAPAGSDLAKSHNPSGKVPALDVDGTVITDSCAIMTYLADKHAGLTYAAGTIERARQDAFLHQINDEIDALLWTAARHSFVLPADKRVPNVKDSLKWEFARNLDRITDQITGPFLMGDTLTIADILLVHCGGWAMAAKFPMENAAFKEYSKSIRSRAAFGRAMGQ